MGQVRYDSRVTFDFLVDALQRNDHEEVRRCYHELCDNNDTFQLDRLTYVQATRLESIVAA